MSRSGGSDHVAVEGMLEILDPKVVFDVTATPPRHITSIRPVRLVNVLSPEVTIGVSKTFCIKVCRAPEFVTLFHPEFKPFDRELIVKKPFWANDSRVGLKIFFSCRVSDHGRVMCILASSTILAFPMKVTNADSVRFPRSPNVHATLIDHF